MPFLNLLYTINGCNVQVHQLMRFLLISNFEPPEILPRQRMNISSEMSDKQIQSTKYTFIDGLIFSNLAQLH